MVSSKNPSISVDCVVFGFDGHSLKVLLVKRRYKEHGPGDEITWKEDYKLPGSPIYNDEELEVSAYRILEELTNLKQVYLRQLQVFSDPNRIDGESLEWLNETYEFETPRIITIAYYSLVKLNPKMVAHTAMRSIFSCGTSVRVQRTASGSVSVFVSLSPVLSVTLMCQVLT